MKESTLPFDTPAALAHNKARMDHLAEMGFAYWSIGKSALEVGAGVGHLTKALCSPPFNFNSLISTEAREENMIEHFARCEGHILQADLNKRHSHLPIGSFDAVVCYGVLYHCAHPETVLETLALACRDVLLLETIVWPEDDGDCHPVEESADVDQSLDGFGCRPARDWIVSKLYGYFPFVYLPKTQPKNGEFVRRWPTEFGTPRAVFVASRRPLYLKTLEYIPFDFDQLPQEYENANG